MRVIPSDPSRWSREEWAALKADLAELEREEGIMEAVREYVRRRDTREAAQATWMASQSTKVPGSTRAPGLRGSTHD